MRIIFEGATANGTKRCTRAPRKLDWVYPQGRVEWQNSGTGTASLTVVNKFTGVEAYSGAIAASGGGQSDTIQIPYQYDVSISGVTGSVAITVAIDGDTGNSGVDV